MIKKELIINENPTLEEIQDMVEAKVNELKLKLNKNIISFLFEFKGEYIIGYATEPTRYQKSLAYGKIVKSIELAGQELLSYCVLKEYSDMRIYSEDQKYDAIVSGAAFKIMETIEALDDLSKKK